MRFERDPETGLLLPRRRGIVRESPRLCSMLFQLQQGQLGRTQIESTGGGGTPLSFVTKPSTGITNGTVASQATGTFVVTTGDHIFVHVRWEGGDKTLSCSDTAGNTYTEIGHTYYATGGGAGGACFYALNATGHATNVVTVSATGNFTYPRVSAGSFSGSTPSSVTAYTQTASTGTNLTTAASLTVAAGGMFFAGETSYSSDSSYTFSDSSSGTWVRVDNAPLYEAAAYRLAASAVSGASVTFTGSNASAGTRVLVALAVTL